MMGPELGVLAISRAGHDRGRVFLIVGRSGSEYVLLADGKTRKLDRPKKKKLRHVMLLPERNLEIAEAIFEGRPLSDADLRRALKQEPEAGGVNTEEVSLV